jgi:hypothetical protein
MRKCLIILVLGVWAAWANAQQAPAEALPEGALRPGFRSGGANPPALAINPFEPIREVKTEGNSEMAKALLKRLKGFVVQPTGVPLLIIDGKSYKVGEKVSLDAAGDSGSARPATAEGAAVDSTAATPQMATIVSIASNEAVFRKDDGSGFGGEVFKIFFNFNQNTNEQGEANYDVWEQVACGFFVSEDGLLVAPLSAVQAGELSVSTMYGQRRATLVESDNKRGLALLKVNMKSLPLPLPAAINASVADPIFPAGYLPQPGKEEIRLLEGFVRRVEAGVVEISPEIDGDMLGSPILSAKGEVVGLLVGDTQTLSRVLPITPSDALFKKYPIVTPAAKGRTTRAILEQSVVRILKKN